jgi:hypothetical protein
MFKFQGDLRVARAGAMITTKKPAEAGRDKN